MKQKSESRYIVGKDEVVTVEIVAIETANTASFVVDTTCKQISVDPIIYEFKISKGPGETHFGELRGAFHGPAPTNPHSDPRFESFFTGSLGGGQFKGPVIRRSDPDHMAGVTFERPAPPPSAEDGTEG